MLCRKPCVEILQSLFYINKYNTTLELSIYKPIDI
jgi:hypothetical protein